MYDLSYTQKHNSICLILFTIIFLTNDEKSSNGEKAGKNVNLTHFSKFSEYTFIWMVFGLRWSMSTMILLKKQNLNKKFDTNYLFFLLRIRNAITSKRNWIAFRLAWFGLFYCKRNTISDTIFWHTYSNHYI